LVFMQLRSIKSLSLCFAYQFSFRRMCLRIHNGLFEALMACEASSNARHPIHGIRNSNPGATIFIVGLRRSWRP